MNPKIWRPISDHPQPDGSVIVRRYLPAPESMGCRTLIFVDEHWTAEHAGLVYAMYRKALRGLMRSGPGQSWKARRFDWWLQRWREVPRVLAARVS